ILPPPRTSLFPYTTLFRSGRLGGLAVLNLEGLQTRYEDPEPALDEIASLPDEKATRRMQEIYAEPIKEELIVQRIREVKDAGLRSEEHTSELQSPDHLVCR